uniref:ZZ-type domain-containing protein n=1 Tax=Trieres chinensis TaxID=1514140 RepID=A0A7S2A6M5_TRICV
MTEQLTATTHAELKLQIRNGSEGASRRIAFTQLWDESKSAVSWDRLVALAVKHSFPSSDNVQRSVEDYRIKMEYIDEDGDTIAVSSDAELAEAFLQCIGKLPPVLHARATVEKRSPKTESTRLNEAPTVVRVAVPLSFDPQFIHGRHTCDGCLCTPIVGIRYHAINHADFDLCQKCIGNNLGKNIEFVPTELDQDRPLQERWRQRRERQSRQARFGMIPRSGYHINKPQHRPQIIPPMDYAMKEAIRRSLLDVSKAREGKDEKEEKSNTPAKGYQENNSAKKGFEEATVSKKSQGMDYALKEAIRQSLLDENLPRTAGGDNSFPSKPGEVNKKDLKTEPKPKTKAEIENFLGGPVSGDPEGISGKPEERGDLDKIVTDLLGTTEAKGRDKLEIDDDRCADQPVAKKNGVTRETRNEENIAEDTNEGTETSPGSSIGGHCISLANGDIGSGNFGVAVVTQQKQEVAGSNKKPSTIDKIQTMTPNIDPEEGTTIKSKATPGLTEAKEQAEYEEGEKMGSEAGPEKATVVKPESFPDQTIAEEQADSDSDDQWSVVDEEEQKEAQKANDKILADAAGLIGSVLFQSGMSADSTLLSDT